MSSNDRSYDRPFLSLDRPFFASRPPLFTSRPPLFIVLRFAVTLSGKSSVRLNITPLLIGLWTSQLEISARNGSAVKNYP